MKELKKYYQSQNPTLRNDIKFYTECVSADPDIPSTVFTRNVATILAKTITKPRPLDGEEIQKSHSPESSLTGLTSKGSKGSIAWAIPLQEMMRHPSVKKPARIPTPPPDYALHQQQRIEILEAKLASMSETASKTSATQSHTSKTSSKLSDDSPLSLASAHLRLDGIESTVLNIQNMLQKMTRPTSSTMVSSPLASPTRADVWPRISRQAGLRGVQLFFEGGDSSSMPSSTVLTVLRPRSHTTPTKPKTSKRRKPTASPSDLSPEYMSSSGDDSC